jgi:hypothetical protein
MGARMLAVQFTEAVAGARTFAQLDHVARLSWRAFAEGHLGEAEAQVISEAVEARRSGIKGRVLVSVQKPYTARRKPVAPDRRASLERRRRVALSGAVPCGIAAAFTMAEIAVLSIIAGEVKRRGKCELPIDAIAAMAGVCRTVVQNACREARRQGIISLTERRRRGQKSATNIVEIIGSAWRSWLKLGGRVQKRKHHVESLSSSLWTLGKTKETGFKFMVCSGHNGAVRDSASEGSHDSNEKHGIR